MAESKEFRDVFNREAVQFLANRLAAVQKDFATKHFVEEVVRDLPPLSLTGRSDRITRGIREHLQGSFSQCVKVLKKVAGPSDGVGRVEGMGGFCYLPLLGFISTYGLEEPEESLAALEHLTRYFSGEFAIRHFIVRHPDVTMRRIREWAKHENPHVRRLASEGTRPRLPWGLRLKAFVTDPAPVLDLLESMRDEPDETVRRSIANNLNDISRDHPEKVVAVASRWLNGANNERQKIIRHALRTLVKQGHGGALAALGFNCDERAIKATPLKLSPQSIKLGQAVLFELTIRNVGDCPASLSIDYAVHHVRANGKTTPKVFKLTKCTLVPGEGIDLKKKHAIVPITTRRYYAGKHQLDVMVNGKVVGSASFDLKV